DDNPPRLVSGTSRGATSMPSPPLSKLLVQWEEAFDQGRELSPEQLAAGPPDLLEPLRAGVAAIRRARQGGRGGAATLPPANRRTAPLSRPAPRTSRPPPRAPWPGRRRPTRETPLRAMRCWGNWGGAAWASSTGRGRWASTASSP